MLLLGGYRRQPLKGNSNARDVAQISTGGVSPENKRVRVTHTQKRIFHRTPPLVWFMVITHSKIIYGITNVIDETIKYCTYTKFSGLLRRFAPRNDGHCERSEAIQSVRHRTIFNWYFNNSKVKKNEKIRTVKKGGGGAYLGSCASAPRSPTRNYFEFLNGHSP